MGDYLGLEHDVRAMSDAKLLQQEREIYDYYVRYSTKSASSCFFGTITACATGGLSLLISAPVATRHVSKASSYGSLLTRYSAEVERRGLQSLETDYWGIAAGVVATVALGAACAAIPGADGVQEAASVAVDCAGGFIESAVESAEDAATEHVQHWAGLTTQAIDNTLDASSHVLPDSAAAAVHDALASLPVDSCEQQLLQEIAHLADAASDALPEILEVSLLTAGAHAAFSGGESLVGVAFTRQAKKDLAKYLASHNKHLDGQAVRQLVEKIHSEPIKFLTQFRNLSDSELLERERELMDGAAKRVGALGYTVGAPLVLPVSVNMVTAVMQVRSTYLMYCELKECKIEVQQRNLPTQYSLNAVAAAAGCLHKATEELALLVVKCSWGATSA